MSIARAQGWIFHHIRGGKHYYYVYAGTEAELMCLAAEATEPLKGKYVSIDEDGKLVSLDRPIMPGCARVIEVTKDETFEGLLR